MNINVKILIKVNCIKIKIFFCAIILFVIATSCNSTKKLLPNQYIVDKVEVVNYLETNLPKENFETFFRQKPNRKFLKKISFYVWWYNLFDDNYLKEMKVKRDLKYDVINSKKQLQFDIKNQARLKKRKKPKIPTFKDKEKPLFLENIREIGEPAVIFDSSLTKQTQIQLNKYLFGKGFYNNYVTDTFELINNSKKIKVKYILHPKLPYKINAITYNLEDDKLGQLILKRNHVSAIKIGDNIDTDVLEIERQSISDFALNNGYYFFENAYIKFDIDTNFKNNTASIVLRLKKIVKPNKSLNDTLIKLNHTRYKIGNIYIVTETVIGNTKDAIFKDTISTIQKGTYFLINNPITYKQNSILNAIDIRKNQWFKRDSAEFTYKQLLNLGIFKNVNIQFYKNNIIDSLLDCFILCSPIIKQSISAQLEGSNTSGNLGINGSINYQNRNFFKDGELIDLRFQGALIAQTQFNSQESSETAINELQNKFNTIQIGPELTFSTPRAFFPFSLFPFNKNMAPHTFIKSSLNFQSSPKFSRVITTINFGINFKTNEGVLIHDVIPIEVYYVNATLSEAFSSSITNFNDAFLINSFQDHLTTLSKYSLAFRSKENSTNSKKTAFYAKLNLQSSGSILKEIYKASGQKTDSLGRYFLYQIPFAHFLRVDFDLRAYMPTSSKTRLVYRIAAGIGKTLSNLNVLPYEQSFFSGGPNSVRAWRARTLGPGGYDPSNSVTRFDKIGDILLEGNLEYRFPMVKEFYGAFFIDAGNIWRISPDKNKPEGDFDLDKFADQIAIGGGFGIRWDLNFFVLRIDMAFPFKDPKFLSGNRWAFDKQPWNYTVLNFGIGYPF